MLGRNPHGLYELKRELKRELKSDAYSETGPKRRVAIRMDCVN